MARPAAWRGGPSAQGARSAARSSPRRGAAQVCTLLAGALLLGRLASTRHLGASRDPGQSAFLQAGTTRRAIAVGVVLGTGAQPALAFKNRIEKLKNEPKSPGKKPDFLGAVPRTEGGPPDLAGCGTTPNCFSSAATADQRYYLEPWRFSAGGAAKAFEDLQAAVSAYQPGQRGIDGGGFQIQEADPKLGYLYVQFESLKRGYKDDVEFLVRADPSGAGGEVRVRSASRQGKKDLGVNAKRLNGIAEQLAKLDGWSAPLLTNKRFPEYVNFNSDREYGESSPKLMNKQGSLIDMVQDFL